MIAPTSTVAAVSWPGVLWKPARLVLLERVAAVHLVVARDDDVVEVEVHRHAGALGSVRFCPITWRRNCVQIAILDGFRISPQSRQTGLKSDDEAWIYLGNTLADLNPGDSIDTAVVFDVPVGTDPESIELHDGPFSEGVTVGL